MTRRATAVEGNEGFSDRERERKKKKGKKRRRAENEGRREFYVGIDVEGSLLQLIKIK